MGKKVNSIRELDRMGLNRHVMCITRNMEEALFFARANPKGSIRTDRIYESAYDLPFYVYEDQEEFEHLIPKLCQHIKEGLILILSNGHAYDAELRYNLVCSIDRDYWCRAEWSTKQVPLRHMYRYPERLISLYGHIDGRLSDWEISNRAANTIDLREIFQRLQELFLVVDAKDLYGKHLEVSVYNTSCGTRNTDMVFWEISTTHTLKRIGL